MKPLLRLSLLIILLGCQSSEDKPLKKFKIYNMHEHFEDLNAYKKYLPIAREFGIEKDVLIGSYTGIFHRAKYKPYYQSPDNNRSILDIHKTYPNRTFPFLLVPHFKKDKLSYVKQLFSSTKIMGLHLRGSKGIRELDSNNPDLWPIYRFAEKNNIPLIIHFEKGSIERIKNILENFPNLRINVPHLLYSIDNLGYVSNMLSSYPNLYTDLSYGYINWLKKNIQRISRKAKEINKLILEHQNQFIWGTDNVITESTFKDPDYLSEILSVYRKLFERKLFHFKYLDQSDKKLNGLALDDSVLEKIYYENANNFMFGTKNSKPITKKQTDKLSILLSGSSLLGEGMAREGNRENNKLTLSKDLKNFINDFDIFHMSNETPLLESPPVKQKKWKFYSSINELTILKELNVGILELTGNHLLDFGSQRFRSLLNKITEWKLPYFGGGYSLRDARRTATIIKNKNRITFIGFNMVSGIAKQNTPGGNPIDLELLERQIAFSKQNGDIVLVHLQWGDEFNPQPYHEQQLIAYQIIDMGADLIVGTHTHSVVGFEVYKRKHIYYGLGNFLFRDDTNEAANIGMLLALTCKNNKIIFIKKLPILNNNGSLILPGVKKREKLVNKWNKWSQNLSPAEKTRLILNISHFQLEDLNHLSRLDRILRKSNTTSTSIYVPSKHYQTALALTRSRERLGIIISDINELNNYSGIQDYIINPNLKNINTLLQANPGKTLTIKFNENWKLKDLLQIINKHKKDPVHWFIDFSLAFANKKIFLDLLKTNRQIFLSLNFTNNQNLNTLTNQFSLNPIKIINAVKLWSNRTSISFGFTKPSKRISTGRMTNYLNRRFRTIRNALETNQYKFLLLEDLGLEWGYTYNKEKLKRGLKLSTKILKDLYSDKH